MSSNDGRRFLSRDYATLTTFVAAVGLVAALLTARGADAAMKVAGDTEKFLKIGGLMQSWAVLTDKGAPDGETISTEFYLRRIRLMFLGQLTGEVNFFIETDNPNFGKGSDFTTDTFIQDAYLELNPNEAFQLDVGMILVPFSHHGMQGATTLLAVDYHSPLFKYPLGSNKVWRDYGIMSRGLLFGKNVEYRLGVFNGVHGASELVERSKGTTSRMEENDPRNPSDLPRLTGRLTYNIFDTEGGGGLGGFFYDGLYLEHTEEGVVSPKKILSIGGSVDWQPDLNVTWEATPTGIGIIGIEEGRGVKKREDYAAMAGDVFWDIPFGEKKINALNGQIDFYYYNHGDRSEENTYYDSIGDKQMFTGFGLLSELGFRYNFIQPVVVFDWFDSTKAVDDHTGDYMAVYGGLNYWMLAHAVTFKLQVGASQVGGLDWTPSGTFQAQLLF